MSKCAGSWPLSRGRCRGARTPGVADPHLPRRRARRGLESHGDHEHDRHTRRRAASRHGRERVIERGEPSVAFFKVASARMAIMTMIAMKKARAKWGGERARRSGIGQLLERGQPNVTPRGVEFYSATLVMAVLLFLPTQHNRREAPREGLW